ncbi:cytochrome P450 [Leucobacter exalbidus]|uniref:Cytochrome P450 n=1 Tax=Leucobacter exalbidus TaxID=662960 RepID=A0A940PW12_9MICO|nr:cytochrome P450 [Leucobacter exalbidus]MBP1326334.1 cytochrome P450 [Leucobacter exalbidus]
MQSSSLPVIHEDPYGEDVWLNPYPFYTRLRDAGPVVYLEKYDAYATGRYDLAREALLDWRRFTSARGVGLADLADSERWPGLKPSGLVEQDPPNHDVARQAIIKLFTAKEMRGLQARLTARAEELVDELLAKGTIDAYEDFAYQFPFSIVPDLIGVPEDGRDSMLPFSSLSIQASTSPHNERIREIMSEAGPLREWVANASKRENLTPDGWGARIWAMVDEGDIDDELAVKLIRALITAGMDTTIFGLVNTIHSLIDFPEQWEKLSAEPDLAKFALDETLRFESPTQTITRTVSEDTELGGIKLTGGKKIIFFTGATGRDDRKWGERAEQYDLTQASRDHLGLGFGIHQCAGQPLARMEVQILLTTFAKKVTNLKLAGEAVSLNTAPLRSWTQLPIEIS